MFCNVVINIKAIYISYVPKVKCDLFQNCKLKYFRAMTQKIERHNTTVINQPSWPHITDLIVSWCWQGPALVLHLSFSSFSFLASSSLTELTWMFAPCWYQYTDAAVSAALVYYGAWWETQHSAVWVWHLVVTVVSLHWLVAVPGSYAHIQRPNKIKLKSFVKCFNILKSIGKYCIYTCIPCSFLNYSFLKSLHK